MIHLLPVVLASMKKAPLILTSQLLLMEKYSQHRQNKVVFGAKMSDVRCQMLGVTQRGFTLLEVTIAVFILVVGIGGAFTLISRTTSSFSDPVDDLTASYLTQEGVEIVRNIRDTNFLRVSNGGGGTWSDGLTGCGGGCEADYTDIVLSPRGATLQQLLHDGTAYSYAAGSTTKFTREIRILENPPNSLDVTVEVFWDDNSVTASTELHNWLDPS